MIFAIQLEVKNYGFVWMIFLDGSENLKKQNDIKIVYCFTVIEIHIEAI